MQLDQPQNSYALAIRLLIDHPEGFSMLVPCKEYFYKFQSRLGEIMKAHPTLQIQKLPMTAKNRYGNEMTYTHYKALSNYVHLVNLYNKLNKIGLKATTKK